MALPFDWTSALSSARRSGADLQLRTTLDAPAESSSNGAFPALLSDGQKWWVKPLPGQHGYPAGVAEIVVARCGGLIGAPVCDVRIVEVPLWLDGERLADDTEIKAQICTASLNLPDVLERDQLDFRGDDSNRERHAEIFGLWDWCLGGDPQWMYDAANDRSTYSHDHGFWLPDGPAWTTATLETWVNEDARWPPGAHTGLSAVRLRSVADALDAVTEQSLLGVVADVPSSWPIPDVKLVALGRFLAGRAPIAAAHLRTLAGTL